MSIFTKPGWVLPVQNTFQYTCKQKIFLYKLFKGGEVAGKKICPEQVYLKMQKEFSPNEYVTIQQIKSLFPRMSSEQHKGMLKEPKSSQPPEDILLSRNEAIIDENEIRETACSVLAELLDLKLNKWVLVAYEGQVFPGIVKKVLNGTVKVKCMEYEISSQNCFRWPVDNDSIWYEYVICKIDAPSISGLCANNKRRETCSCKQ